MDSLTLPELPYDHSALEPHLSAQILELHHGKHHAGYVTKATTALEQLAEARASDAFDQIAALERDLAFNLSGHRLHSIYWTNLSPDGGGEPDGELRSAVDESFGSFDAFRRHLTASTGSVMGSGWGALAWEPDSGRLIVEQIYDHQSNVVQGSQPLLVFDAWEHAFYLQYHNDKAAYIDVLWNLVDWSDVERRFTEARTGERRAA